MGNPLVIPNHHDASADFTVERGDYIGLFENEHGEQMVLVANATRATLYVGDAEWTAYEVALDRPLRCVLSDDEAAWLRACMDAVYRRRTHGPWR